MEGWLKGMIMAAKAVAKAWPPGSLGNVPFRELFPIFEGRLGGVRGIGGPGGKISSSFSLSFPAPLVGSPLPLHVLLLQGDAGRGGLWRANLPNRRRTLNRGDGRGLPVGARLAKKSFGH